MISRIKAFLFENRNTRQTITKNIFWLSLNQIGSRFFRAIIIIYAARVLGATEYGIFAYVLGVIGVFTLFTDIGVNSILTRSVASHPDKRDQYLSTSFWIKMGLLFITALLLIFVAPHFSKIGKATVLFPIMVLIVTFDNIGEFINSFLRGMEKMELEAFISVIENVIFMVAGFIFIAISPTSKSLIFSYLASMGFAALLAIFIIRDRIVKVFHYFINKKLAYEIINAAWPFALFGVIGIFLLNTDIIMLGWMRTSGEIGYYSAGQRIIGILYVLPSIFLGSIFPALSRFVQQNKKEKERELNEKSMALIFAFSLPLVVGGIVLAPSIIQLIYGQNYLPAVPAFRILLASIFFAFPGSLLANLVLAHNQQKKMIVYLAVAAIGNIVVNFFLIPVWGNVGSALATLINQAIYVIPIWWQIKKVTNFKTFYHIKKIIMATIIMGIFSLFFNYLKVNVILSVIASGGIYFWLLFLFKEKILEEILILLRKFKGASAN